jgi:hypothetical protein
MDELSKEDRDFLEVLAGRKSGTAGQEALRGELLAAARVLQEAQEAIGKALDSDELAQREALRARLIQAGALARRDAETTTVPASAMDAVGATALVQPGDASNDAWYHLGQLAASDGDDGTTPTSYQPDGVVAGDFKIHRSYSKARNVVLLRFEASSEAVPPYVGRRIRIKVQGREPIDLGIVDEYGQASCTVQGPVVLADASVNIGN